MRIIGLWRGVIPTITALILVAEIPSAFADEHTPIAAAYMPLVMKDSLEFSDRVKVAQNIGDFCRPIADAIPTLSPREQDWLRAEMNAGGSRFDAALSSPEVSKQYTGRVARNCVSYAETLGKLLATDTESARRSQAVFWALLATELLSEDFDWRVGQLRRKGIIRFQEADMAGIKLMPRLGQEIVKKILVFHLADEAGMQIAPSP